MPQYEALKDHRTEAQFYRKGEVYNLDPLTARSLKARGVIPDEPIDESGPEDTPESEGGGEGEEFGPEETPEVGPSETKEGEGTDEQAGEGDTQGYTPEWFEKAQSALKSDNGNKIRSALADAPAGDTSKWKEENTRRLEKEIDKAKAILEGEG